MRPDPTPDDILLRLSLVEGLGPARLARLLRRDRGCPVPPAGDGEPVADADRDALRRAVDAALSPEAGERAARVRESCAAVGARIVGIDSDGYPPLLRSVPDAPAVVYAIGDPGIAQGPVAVVGSRAPTSAAAEFARALSTGLAATGCTVVSGMARGIDAAAHDGALRGGGRTIAVLGCGVDVVYPPEARRLRERIAADGALLSEYPPGTPPLPRHFPARNRLISGLSRGVVVVEAGARSGALITARFALEQGREVMAVPGNPVFPHTEGSNALLRDGAILVAGADDVTAAVGWGGRAGPRPCPETSAGGATARERDILRFLSSERTANDLADGLGIPVAELLPCLLDMELRKLLERRAGDYYKKLSI